MEDAESVIVFFFPYTEDIRRRLAQSETVIAESRKYGYAPGSILAKEIAAHLKEQLAEQDISAIEPTSTERFVRTIIPASQNGEESAHYMVSWSTPCRLCGRTRHIRHASSLHHE